jgi:hypothetical protein
MSLSDVLALKNKGYKDVSQDQLGQIALGLVPCLGHKDTDIRDGLVYESYAQFLRGDALSAATKIELFESVLSAFSISEDLTDDDPTSFTRPFAALDLSELARADRISAYLSVEQRENLVLATVNYLNTMTDYRGFDDQEGWRHGIAHTADLVLQMTLNPNIGDDQLTRLRTALSAQIAPKSGHAYIHGESERLARPIIYMARRGSFDAQNWHEWAAQLGDPAPLTSWNNAYISEQGLARLHNIKAFLNVIYINANESSNENIKMLYPASRDVLLTLP